MKKHCTSIVQIFKKPGHCSWSSNDYCCMWGSNEEYARCQLVKVVFILYLLHNALLHNIMMLLKGKSGETAGPEPRQRHTWVWDVSGQGWCQGRTTFGTILSDLSALGLPSGWWMGSLCQEFVLDWDAEKRRQCVDICYPPPTQTPPHGKHFFWQQNLSFGSENHNFGNVGWLFTFLPGGWYRYKKASREVLAYDGEDWDVVGELETPRASVAATKIDASRLMGFC